MKWPSHKEDWDTITFTKSHWPIDTWTYKRSSHPFMWTIFGNDNDGVTPWFKNRAWGFWEWWLRNTAHNFMWYVLGIANWNEAMIPYSSHDTSHLEAKPDWLDLRFLRLSLVRRIGGIWRPFIYIKLPFSLKFWIGWKPTRGQFALSLKVRD